MRRTIVWPAKGKCQDSNDADHLRKLMKIAPKDDVQVRPDGNVRAVDHVAKRRHVRKFYIDHEG